jgi:hypothetical protein
LQKQALLVESGLNRLRLQAEVRNLRSRASEIRSTTRKRAPLLLVLAPLAGLLLAKGARRSIPWFNRLVRAAKWIGPAYTVWRSLSAYRGRKSEAEQSAD